MNELAAARIVRVENENSKVKTFILDCAMPAKAGQFVMLWLPGAAEKPVSISYAEPLGVSIAKVGEFSGRMHHLKEGALVGVRGPYGNGFGTNAKRVAMVGGGYGVAPLALLAEQLKGKAVAVLGAKTKGELLFEQRIKKTGARVIACTDDGSYGRKGFVTDALAELLRSERFDAVCTCGPEAMMKKVSELCEAAHVECFASLERYMKCGFGICGQCVIDGQRVCADGPVFSSQQLRGFSEFGKAKRDASGRAVKT
jgi:dihydroorotate dehydrogenase electron transfer subunit